MEEIKTAQAAKNIKSQLSALRSDIESWKIQIALLQKELNLKTKTYDQLSEKLKELDNSDNITISDHAIVRYFERVKGDNMDEIRNKILPPEVVAMIKTLGGNGTYPNDGFSIVVKNHNVITIKT